MSTRVQPRTEPVGPTVPEAPAALPTAPRFVLLDGARALAALLILVTHTAALTGFNAANPLGAWTARMDSGVAIFFVLSGFLLYRPWVAARLEGRPGPRVRAYAGRRALRILPAYWVALTLLGLAFTAEVPGVFSEDWWIYYGLLQSYSVPTILGGIGVAWSLSIEAAFYLLLPVLAVCGARALRGRPAATQVRVELLVLAATAAAALASRIVVRSSGWESTWDNTLPGLWPWFAAGMGLAVVSVAHAGRPLSERPALVRSATERPALWWFGALVALTLAAKAVGLPRTFGDPYGTAGLQLQHVLYGLIAVFLVAPAVFADGRRSVVSVVLGHPALAWLGLISYGLFLYHLPLAQQLQPAQDWLPGSGFLVVTALTFVAATACAAASYYVVERPLLRRRARR